MPDTKDEENEALLCPWKDAGSHYDPDIRPGRVGQDGHPVCRCDADRSRHKNPEALSDAELAIVHFGFDYSKDRMARALAMMLRHEPAHAAWLLGKLEKAHPWWTREDLWRERAPDEDVASTVKAFEERWRKDVPALTHVPRKTLARRIIQGYVESKAKNN